MKLLMRIMSYLLVAVLAAAAATGICMDQIPEPGKLTELQALIESRFIGEVDPVAMEDAAAEAMVEAIGDRWSYYIPADQWSSYVDTMNNSYVGIGITITTLEDGGFLVQQVAKGSPAESGGVLPGDLLVGVSGQDATKMTSDEVGSLIRGKEGTDVVVSFQRDGKVLDFTLTRSAILTVVAEGQMLSDTVGYVKIVNFDERCADETLAQVKQLLESGATALVFDVRNNPGGYKKELVEVLDYLLPEGPLFRSLNYKGVETVDESDADCLKLPMAVLVNADSYSAAEFFAAALSEYEAAIVVGEATTGKGYFQTALQLSDGSAVNLSVGKYFTPNNVCLADVGGLVPDVVVPVDEETAFHIYAGLVAPQDDPQVQKAVEALRNP